MLDVALSGPCSSPATFGHEEFVSREVRSRVRVVFLGLVILCFRAGVLGRLFPNELSATSPYPMPGEDSKELKGFFAP